MVLVRLGDGRIIIHSAIALDEPQMKEIEAWGTPSFLIVPNGGHRMDAKIFKARYPALQVIAPPGAKEKVEEVLKVDRVGDAFDDDDGVRYAILDGTKEREGVLSVPDPDGTTLVFNDVLMNMRSLPGFTGAMMGLFGFTGPTLKVAFPARMALVADKRALSAQLDRLAAVDHLTRIEVAHGVPVVERPSEALRAAAGGLR
jgi:hypothetical protein